MDAELLAILACPKCKNSIELITEDGADRGLACRSCAVVYPIEEAIPVLLIEEAIPKADWEAGKRTKK